MADRTYLVTTDKGTETVRISDEGVRAFLDSENTWSPLPGGVWADWSSRFTVAEVAPTSPTKE